MRSGDILVGKVTPKGETELVDAVNKIIDEVLEQGLYDQWLEEATAEAENLGL